MIRKKGTLARAGRSVQRQQYGRPSYQPRGQRVFKELVFRLFRFGIGMKQVFDYNNLGTQTRSVRKTKIEGFSKKGWLFLTSNPHSSFKLLELGNTLLYSRRLFHLEYKNVEQLKNDFVAM